MDMTVPAFFDIMSFQDVENAVINAVPKDRRIMEKHQWDKSLLFSGGYRRFKSPSLTGEDLSIGRLTVFGYPAPRAADAVAFIAVMIVVEYAYGIEAIFGEIFCHFAHSAPPVVVVTL